MVNPSAERGALHLVIQGGLRHTCPAHLSPAACRPPAEDSIYRSYQPLGSMAESAQPRGGEIGAKMEQRRTDSSLTLRSFEALTLLAEGRERAASPVICPPEDAPRSSRPNVQGLDQGMGVQGSKPRPSSPYVRKKRDSEGSVESFENEGSQKRQRRKSVSFGHTLVRHVAAYDPDAEEFEVDNEHDDDSQEPPPPSSGAARAGLEPCDLREDTKQLDGPAVETVCVDKMVVELFKKRDPTIVTRTLNVIVEKGTLDTIGGVRGRVDGLVRRLRKNGKVSLLPSCVVLKGHSLAVLEWMSDCASKAGDLMTAARGKATSPFGATLRGPGGLFAGGGGGAEAQTPA